MNPFFVDTYFLKLAPKLLKVVNSPVHLSEDPSTIVGEIIGYDERTGFAKIFLFNPVFCERLLEEIPIENIVFPAQG